MTYSLSSHSTPNRSTRGGVAPKFFVMHVTEGSFDGAVSWLCNPAAQASADEVVSQDGSRVAVLNTAASKLKSWAVGNGNPQSMSWENEGHSGQTHWPDAHYDTLADRLIKAQAAVKRTYGVTIPLRRTTSPSHAGICGHGDMAHWFGGSDHYSCPGPTFDYDKLFAAIARRTAPKPTYTGADLWRWAAWYCGVGKFKGHRRDPQLRPRAVPRRVPAAGWKRVAWYVAHVLKPAKEAAPTHTPVEWVQVIGKDGKVLAEAERGDGRESKMVDDFHWIDQTRNAGPLTVKVVKK